MLRVEERTNVTICGCVGTIIQVGKTLSSLKSIALNAFTDSEIELRVRSIRASIAIVFIWNSITNALISDNRETWITRADLF
ncbi:MAG TPA: hypothetical protein PLD02_05860 [Saprospiraceae bacterium]|nr:hypothetical protein [Saprospiraceae bacterium]